MSTTMTATFPNLEFSSDPASGTLHGSPTMPFGALAWSAAEPEEPVVQPETAPVVTARKPRISRVAIAGVLFGGITVAAALGAIALGGNDSPSTPLAVVDHAQLAPYVPPAPAPMSTVSHVAAPVPVAGVVTVPVVVPPKVVTSAQPTVAPPAAETPKPTQHQPHWNWLRRAWQHHDQDGQDQQDQKR